MSAATTADFIVAATMLVSFLLFVVLSAKRKLISPLPAFVLTPLLFSVGILFYYPTSPLFIQSDGIYYLAWADSIATAMTGGEPEIIRQVWPGKGVWPSILAAFQLIVGAPVFSGIALSSIASTMAVRAIQKSVYLITTQQVPWLVLLFFLPLAPFFIFGPSLLRESLFWLGTSFGILAMCHAWRRHSGFSLAFTCLSSFLLVAIRPDLGFFLSFGFSLFVITTRLNIAFRISKVASTLTGIWLFLLVSLGYPTFAFLTQDSPSAQNPALVGEKLSGDDVASGFGDGSILPSFELRAARVLFGPFLHEFEPVPVWYITFLSTFHFWLTIVFAIIFAVKNRRNRLLALGLSSLAVMSLAIFTAVLTNYGILMRFRIVTELLLAPLAISGLLCLKETWTNPRNKFSREGR